MRNHTLFLQDILQAISRIEFFIAGMDFDGFAADDRTLSAVVRKLEIIGEAVKHIPEYITHQQPLVPWKQIAGMRDKLIHSYFGVDSHLVWQTVHNRLPELKNAVVMLLEDELDKA